MCSGLLNEWCFVSVSRFFFLKILCWWCKGKKTRLLILLDAHSLLKTPLCDASLAGFFELRKKRKDDVSDIGLFGVYFSLCGVRLGNEVGYLITLCW